MRALLLAIVLVIPTSADADEYDRNEVMATVSVNGGATTISEIATDGASAMGSSVGFGGTLLYQLTPRWSAGIGLVLDISGHDTDDTDHLAVYSAGVAPLVGRMERGRFGAMAWAGYAFGRRSISMRSTGDELSSARQHGFGAEVEGFVRLKSGPICLEAGPYVQLVEMWSTEDASATMVDEDGMRRQGLSIGLVLQVAFGSGPTR